jgi:putative acetyltransferase
MRLVLVRRETPDDADRIREIHLAAFEPPPGRAAAVEAGLVDDLRADAAAWVPQLSLVAEDPAGAVAGHVVCTRGTLGGVPGALGLGPLGVHPAHQRRGAGLALMHAVLGAADALGAPVVALLGDPAYYSRFGFVTATDLGIAPPEPAWGVHFQARTLTAYDPARHRGAFAYAPAFDGL